MRIITTIILAFSFFSLHAQTTEIKPGSPAKKEFKNQGEQEDYWTKEFFENNYFKQVFDKYTGEVTITGNCFGYSDQVFVVVNTSKELKSIFSKGVFYPAIITGQTKINLKNKEELDTLTVAQRYFYTMARTDSLTVSSLEELTFLSKTPTQKRFRFWLFSKGLLNPKVCFFELINQDATEKTDMGTFINGAVLTFYKEGWIII